MIEGRYTAKEIEEMRASVYRLMSSWSFFGPGPSAADVERRLLTHMQSGTLPEELAVLAAEKQERDREAFKEHEARCAKEGRNILGGKLQ